jgi:hypothetical protein
MTAHRFTPKTARAAVQKAHAGSTAEQRSASAKKAAAARWRKEKGDDWTPPAEDVSLTPFYEMVDEQWPGLAPAARTAQAERLRSDYSRGTR